MLDIKQIESYYPENLWHFKRNLLREYLQYKILETIYESNLGRKLVFMGGTAVHIIHGNTRFSEDLDFDNRGLEKTDLDSLISEIMIALERQGYKIESRNVYRKAFKSYLKFSDLLYDLKISRHRHEKLNIQIDSEPQEFEYEPDKVILNKFDVFIRINAVPPDILLAQKLHCIFSRPRLLGRDFYDIIFLFGKTKPNLSYLQEKIGIQNYPDLKEKLIASCANIELKRLAKDIEPFLFDSKGAKKVLYFLEFIKTLNF